MSDVAAIESARLTELEQAEIALRWALRAAESTVVRLTTSLQQAEARTAAQRPVAAAAWDAAR